MCVVCGSFKLTDRSKILAEFFRFRIKLKSLLCKFARATSLLPPVIIDCKIFDKNLQHWKISWCIDWFNFSPISKIKTDTMSTWQCHSVTVWHCNIVTLWHCDMCSSCRQKKPCGDKVPLRKYPGPFHWLVRQTEKLWDTDWDQRHVEPGRERCREREREMWEMKDRRIIKHTWSHWLTGQSHSN